MLNDLSLPKQFGDWWIEFDLMIKLLNLVNLENLIGRIPFFLFIIEISFGLPSVDGFVAKPKEISDQCVILGYTQKI